MKFRGSEESFALHPRLTAAVEMIVIGISVVLWQAVPTSQQTGWQISDLDIGITESPDIASDPDGNALAVWWNIAPMSRHADCYQYR